MNALSAEGFSIIYLEIEPDEDDETVVEDLRTAVDSVVDFLMKSNNQEFEVLIIKDEE